MCKQQIARCKQAKERSSELKRAGVQVGSPEAGGLPPNCGSRGRFRRPARPNQWLNEPRSTTQVAQRAAFYNKSADRPSSEAACLGPGPSGNCYPRFRHIIEAAFLGSGSGSGLCSDLQSLLCFSADSLRAAFLLERLNETRKK